MTRSILQYTRLPLRFWGFAVIAVYYVQNRMPIRPDGKCPKEAFTGHKVSVSHIRIFGYIIYAYISKKTRDKLKLVVKKVIFIDYLPMSKQYQLYNPVAKEILVSSTPTFKEDKFWE